MESYGRICAEFYDIDKPEPPRDALAFYRAYAQAAGGPILEPMCGTGRFLIPLLREGFDIEGSDASEAMLERCRNNAGTLPLKVELQNLKQARSARKFALAFIPSGSLSLIADLDELRAGLRAIRSLLLPKSKFVFEVEKFAAHAAYAGPWGGRWVTRGDGARFLISWLSQSGENDPVSRSLHRYEVFKGGRLLDQELESFTLRSFRKEEIEALVLEAGFNSVVFHRCYEIRPPRPEDSDWMVEATA